MNMKRYGPAQMALMGWAAGGYVVITAIFCYIFVKGREGRGWQEGLRYGALVGLFMGCMSIVNYALLPIELIAGITGLVQSVIIYAGGGIVTALIYKP